MIDVAAERARVVAIAHEWIGTRYQHGARIKGVCCDCTFPAKVYEEARVTGPIAIAPYVSNAHLHRASGQYALRVREIARQVERGEPGDLALFFLARDYSHSGIITAEGWPWIIHADMAAGAVLKVRADSGELTRASRIAFFSPKRW